MKIGLFGGSFSPIHASHIKIVNSILKKNLVDEVWVMPCYSHNFKKGLTVFEDRVEMIKLAFNSNPRVKICEIEREIGGISKTYGTLLSLQKKFNHDFSLIIGSDILSEIDDWYMSTDLLSLTSFIVYEREKHSIPSRKDLRVLDVINESVDDVSSSEIRERIKKNLSVEELLPDKVLAYIKKKGLYKN